jgi:tetratricopeptide (TPR) repeat protein
VSSRTATPPTFEGVVDALELGISVYSLRNKPMELAGRLSERIKLAAKFLAKTSGVQHSRALEAIAQAVRLPSWHHLSAHLARATDLEASKLPTPWADALRSALLLLAKTAPDIAMPQAQLQAFQELGQTLSMLTDTPLQAVLDGVCAPLCAGRTWASVNTRSPLKATTALYRFVVSDIGSDETGGHFEESPACAALVEELDEQWQGYDNFTKPHKREARMWVEDALAAQPGFLEAGLALASMQQDAGEAEASATCNRFIRQAEALIPADYKGPIAWAHLDNRFYHRLLWLRMQMRHQNGELAPAVKLARKQLKLNPNDNLGVRYVLPLLLLQQGEHVAARRASAKYLEDESGLTAALIRAFCEHALDNHALFRRELAAALFSLPWLRLFLLNQREPLPDGDDGIRAVQPDMETFTEFAWPVYVALPGLRKACQSFLVEPDVLQAESELRRYWKGYWRRDGNRTGSREGWDALCNKWIDATWRRPLEIGQVRGA